MYDLGKQRLTRRGFETHRLRTAALELDQPLQFCRKPHSFPTAAITDVHTKEYVSSDPQRPGIQGQGASWSHSFHRRVFLISPSFWELQGVP